jgi:predicted secreted protein
MRLVIAGTILAFAMTAASAQAPAPKISGTKAFCMKGTDKVECNFDTMAACQKMSKEGSSDQSKQGTSCVSRSEAR